MLLVAAAIPLSAQTTPKAFGELARLRRENDSLRKVIQTLRPSAKPSAAATSAVSRELIPDRQDGSHPGTVTTEYDRFKNQTEAKLTRVDIGSGFNLTAYYLMPGSTPSLPDMVGFLLSHSSTDWEYLRCSDVSMLADGAPVEVQDAQHDGTVGRGYVIEYITFHLSVSTLLRLTRAKQIDLRVCTTEMSLGSKEISALTDLASRMK